MSEAEGKAVNAAEEAKKAAVDGFDQEVEKLGDAALQEVFFGNMVLLADKKSLWWKQLFNLHSELKRILILFYAYHFDKCTIIFILK